jgi:CheY-like chemotaxis protein
MAEDERKKVLVVDDDPRNRKLMEMLIQADGFAVRSVDSGPAALAAVAAEPPEHILLDIMMPGMDGFDVLRRLKADPLVSRIPVVMVTALDDEASRTRLGAAGASRVITKPVDRWALRACLAEFLGDRKV